MAVSQRAENEGIPRPQPTAHWSLSETQRRLHLDVLSLPYEALGEPWAFAALDLPVAYDDPMRLMRRSSPPTAAHAYGPSQPWLFCWLWQCYYRKLPCFEHCAASGAHPFHSLHLQAERGAPGEELVGPGTHPFQPLRLQAELGASVDELVCPLAKACQLTPRQQVQVLRALLRLSPCLALGS